MFERRKPDVLIAGAGPVGMFTALALSRRGIKVKIVDQEWRTGAHSYALALHPRSLALLEEVGVLGGVLDHAYHVRSVGIYEGGERRATLRLGDLHGDYSFVAVLQQNVLEDLLESALERRGIEVEWNHHLVAVEPTDEGVVATIDRLERSSFGYAIARMEWVVAKTRRIEVPFVIGADGHLSLVRSALAVEFRNYRPPKHFAVFEFKTDAELDHEMRLVFHGDTTNVLWPLPEGYCRWSFELSEFEALLAPREKDRLEFELGQARYPVLAPDHLHELLVERAPWFEGSVEEIRWRTVVRFDTRLVTSFGRDRMWLTGDAAHMTGPAGIQSMNVGLIEANDLANRLAAVLRGRAELDSLAAYGREHMANWHFLLGMAGTFEPGPDAEPWVERCVDRLLPSIPASGDDLADLAGQIGIEANVPAGSAVAG